MKRFILKVYRWRRKRRRKRKRQRRKCVICESVGQWLLWATTKTSLTMAYFVWLEEIAVANWLLCLLFQKIKIFSSYTYCSFWFCVFWLFFTSSSNIFQPKQKHQSNLTHFVLKCIDTPSTTFTWYTSFHHGDTIGMLKKFYIASLNWDRYKLGLYTFQDALNAFTYCEISLQYLFKEMVNRCCISCLRINTY